jgi:hypothetical protein
MKMPGTAAAESNMKITINHQGRRSMNLASRFDILLIVSDYCRMAATLAVRCPISIIAFLWLHLLSASYHFAMADQLSYAKTTTDINLFFI